MVIPLSYPAVGTSLAVVTLNEEVLDAAGALTSPALKTLDAIHLASAGQLGGGVTRFITYDQGLGKIAAEAGFPVFSPQ